jgi:hypothetical protein
MHFNIWVNLHSLLASVTCFQCPRARKFNLLSHIFKVFMMFFSSACDYFLLHHFWGFFNISDFNYAAFLSKPENVDKLLKKIEEKDTKKEKKTKLNNQVVKGY